MSFVFLKNNVLGDECVVVVAKILFESLKDLSVGPEQLGHRDTIDSRIPESKK